MENIKIKHFSAVDDEIAYLQEFIREHAEDIVDRRDQLRALWTALCLHRDWEVDTGSYDHALICLWQNNNDLLTRWKSFDAFDNFMCRYLV